LILAASFLAAVSPSFGATQETARPQTRGPRAFALVIGITDYPRNADKPIPASQGAERDAFAFANYLTAEAGWDAENVLRLLDSGADAPAAKPAKPGTIKPTRKNLNDFALKTWLNDKLGPNPTSDDLVVIYFAGQAARFDRGYLMALDGTWAIDDAVDSLAARGVSVLCLLDTSLHGRGTAQVPGSKAPGDGRDFLQRLTRRPGVSAWLAASTGRAAVARRATEHSPFLAAILQGLGKADGSRNNLVATLGHVRHDPKLAAGGFASSGNLHPRFTLWQKDARGVDRTPELLLQRGHSNHVDHLAFSPAGDMLFTAGADSTLRLWRLSDRRLWRVLAPHYRGVKALAVSDDGRLAVVGDGEGYITIWDHEHRRRVSAVGVTEGKGCDAVAFLADSNRFVSRDRNGQCRLWSPDKEGLYKSQPVAKSSLAVAVSPVAAKLGFVTADGVPGKPARLLRFTPDGSPLGAIDGPSGRVTGATLATDGRRIVAGDSAGHLLLHDEQTGKPAALPDLGEPVRSLSLSAGRLAVAGREQIVVHDVNVSPPVSLCTLELPKGTPDPAVLLSPDGKTVCVKLESEQTVLAWSLEAPAKPRAITLDTVGPRVSSLAFSPDGRLLMAGCQDGSVRSWSLESGGPAVALPKSRGRVASLSADASGRFLLELTHDGYAFVWNLENGGAPTRLRENAPGEPVKGQWHSGTIAPDGKTIYLAHKERGDVVAFDPANGRIRANPPEMPKEFGANGRIDQLVAARIVKSGRLAGVLRDKPGFCVWNADGSVQRVAVDAFAPLKLKGRELAITTIDISDDGKALLVMGRSGVVAVYDLETPSADDPRQAKLLGSLKLKDVAENSEGLFAKFINDPKQKGPRRILLAHALPNADGDGVRSPILSWTVGQNAPATFVPAIDGRIQAMAVSGDGRWLTVGSDHSLEVWDLSAPRPRTVRVGTRPNHLERITSLVVQAKPAMIISGSDDTMIHFWPLDGASKQSLLGSISVDQNTGAWVAHTAKLKGKEGGNYVRFDSSIGGEIGVSWIDGDEVRTLEQFGQESRRLGLTNDLRLGVMPGPPEDVAPRIDDPPRLVIESPDQRLSRVSTTDLTIALGDERLDDLRLYQNGVPVEVPEQAWKNRNEVTIPVTLVHGENRFYAMASRGNAIDGRSNDVDMIYRGAEDEPRLHVLAIGVGEYHDKAMILRYAVKDATDFANHLQRDQPPREADQGYLRIIKDGEVNEANIDSAFNDLIKRVKGRPQDRDVLFLAGHTEVNGRIFSLLLPSFRPGVKAAAAQLPLAALYRNMTRLSALNRAVVVDACRTQEIAKDPLIRRVRTLFDEHAHRARTTYILAARQGGQLIGEVKELEHGVLTYVLLRGLKAPGLKVPPQAEFLSLLPSGADEDESGVVTTDELGSFADRNVPKLVKTFPQLVQRAGRRSTPNAAAVAGRPTDETPSDPSPEAFPLFRLPSAPVAVGDAAH
jgi:WD40 repeat protein